MLSWALTTVRVLLLIAVTLTISLLVPSSNVQKKISPDPRLGKTLPSATAIDVADDDRLDARVVFALFLILVRSCFFSCWVECMFLCVCVFVCLFV